MSVAGCEKALDVATKCSIGRLWHLHERFSRRFRADIGVKTGMEKNRFETPVTVKSAVPGENIMLQTAREANDYLLNSWTGKRGPKHREALQACSDVIAGSKPAMTARRAFIAAAREASVFVSDKAAS